MAIRFSTSRWTSANTRSSGSETSRNVSRERPRRGQQRALAAEHLVQPPARDVRERQQPQRLAGRRAVDDDHVPLARLDVALELEQANSSSPPGGTVSSSAAIRSTPALGEQRRRATPAPPTSCAPAPPGPAPAGPTGRRRRRSARRPRAPPATRRASAPGRSRARSCAAPRRRSGVPWRRRPTSSRRRPCPCRGWSAGHQARQPTVALLLGLQDRRPYPRPSPTFPARSVAVSVTCTSPRLARHLPAERALAVPTTPTARVVYDRAGRCA